jgi:tRNA-specific 2-thiouridylase
LQAGQIGAAEVSQMLGGLAPGKFHAADLVADAFHVALGQAVWADGQCERDDNLVLVAMSGGVDSSVVTQVMKDRGHRLAGVTVELWRDEDNHAESSCCSYSAVRRARLQAHRLGLPHFTLPLLEQFRQGVIEPYIKGHSQGVTPNPCVACNGDVRLDAMMDFADRIGAAGLATGHYARLVEDDEGVLVAQGLDVAKDQSYMLAGVKPEVLSRMHLPLGELHKTQVREIAAEHGLLAAKTPDSQDLCFLAGTDRYAFLAKHGGLGVRPGNVVDTQGNVLGQHDGAHLYTVGQRKGLGVSLGVPTYVVRVDAKNNLVVVGSREDLMQAEVPLGGVRLWRQGARVNRVRLRSKQKPLACQLGEELAEGRHGRTHLLLQDITDGGVAPGQSAVLMSDDRVVGVATILAR